MQDLEPDVTIDTVPNVKKQHEVNVGMSYLILYLYHCNYFMFDEICCDMVHPMSTRAAISNSFGFGGHNSVVVFAPYKP